MFKLWSFDNFHLWCSAVTFPDVFPLNWAQGQVNPGVQSPQPIFVIAKNENSSEVPGIFFAIRESRCARTYPLCIVCENLWSKSSLFFNAASKTSLYLASVFILRGSELPLTGFKISPSSLVTYSIKAMLMVASFSVIADECLEDFGLRYSWRLN